MLHKLYISVYALPIPGERGSQTVSALNYHQEDPGSKPGRDVSFKIPWSTPYNIAEVTGDEASYLAYAETPLALPSRLSYK